MKRRWIWGILFFAALALNLAAWKSARFVDFYAEHIFPVLGGLSSRILSVFPFSVGEWMLVAGLILLAFLALSALLRIFLKKNWTKRLLGVLGRGAAWIFLALLWVMTCNCFVLYHASDFEDIYMEAVRENGYSGEELGILRDYIVANVNQLSGQLERDSAGHPICRGDLSEEAVLAMQRMGEEYGRLKGFYPRPKEMYFSGLLSQTYMMGYYFPFSMEANYNGSMYSVNKPSAICHEMAHLKGFLQEDEASLIGYLACVGSEDPFFRYSGYMGVLSYVEKEFRAYAGKNRGEYDRHPCILPQVYQDSVFLTQEAWQEVEKRAVVSTQTAKTVSRAATTAVLKLNGVEEGMKTYDGVVKLLLDYYDGILYGDVLTTVDRE
ncbi:MAG: DUF3810 domain-containing protein [Eubacteriales bacterium]|nr:DUF3810 domain-containing protein [Eubacteriales bacterium]